MFHKNVSSSLRSGTFPAAPVAATGQIEAPLAAPRLILVPAGGDGAGSRRSPSPFYDLLTIAAPRCSAFLAEAAVLVLVLALLDRFMLKGRMEIGWVASAFTISLSLLAASIVTEFSARRWLRAH